MAALEQQTESTDMDVGKSEEDEASEQMETVAIESEEGEKEDFMPGFHTVDDFTKVDSSYNSCVSRSIVSFTPALCAFFPRCSL